MGGGWPADARFSTASRGRLAAGLALHMYVYLAI